MDNKHKVIEPEKLEVGMEVAYPIEINFGWGKIFRYPIWVKAFVKRITPKRTKVILLNRDGTTTDIDLKRDAVYELDEYMEHEKEYVGMYRECRKILFDYYSNKWKELATLSDMELKKAHTHLTALNEIMKKENQ